MIAEAEARARARPMFGGVLADRALRIYEGATDVQRRIVGRAVLAASKENDA